VSITVYWSCLENEWVKASQPENISKKFYEIGITSNDKNSPDAINYCPVFNSYLKNTYAIKSIYDYKFKIENNNCFTEDYNQDFFNEHVNIRNIEKKFFSFYQRYIFFTEEDSLEMMAYQYPIFENNKITERCMLLPGQFDIGKYFRNLEFPFILKNDFNEFIVNENDVLYYLKFNTDKKINFKQFKMDSELLYMMQSNRQANLFSKSKKPISIDLWYKRFKGKKYILEKIKQNLLD